MDTKERAGKLFSKAIDKSLCCNDIETAIKQARNDALEEAAKVAEDIDIVHYWDACHSDNGPATLIQVARAIRDLKEK